MDLKIFTVGGTIDKLYFDQNSNYKVGDPIIIKILSELNLNLTYSIESVLRKDSLDLTIDDRKIIYEFVQNCRHSRIIITHGTDTMIQTAKALQPIQGKTIIFTGALEPALFKTSDAVFNVGGAIIAAQSLPPGVYIIMNGRIFSPDNVVKNRRKGLFEELNHNHE